ncbi:putative ABC transporter ATP-binding protein YheS [Roseibium album]|nr:putative ABC transporter ATP-binding protein YheS [Roseibium album]
MLKISDLTYRIGDRLLIDRASVTLAGKAKTGLVGRNGAGKSTLFKIITGDLSTETGSVQIPKRAKIGQVAQEAPGTEDTLMEVVLAADKERTHLLQQAESETDPHKIADIHTRLADIGSHTAEARAGTILSGLGFDAAAQQRPCSSFSGGWRMRVALAAVLFSEPDLLLLDEPTNYLDLEGTLWLENYVARYPHQVLLISHDRDLLNNAVNSIVHLEGGKLTYYSGGYDSFDRQRREALILAGKAKVKQDAQRKHMQAFVDRFRYKASKARQAQSRLKMLEKMQPISALTEASSKPIHFPDPEAQLAPPILKLENVSTGYGDLKILSQLTLNIDTDDRIALLGANGNGKSTFAKLISGRLAAMDGELVKASKLKIAFFAQHQLDELKPSESSVAHVRAIMPDAPEAKVRARVARFGLPTDRMSTPAKDLSGGEKARLLLGLATFDGPHLLILDEPTNHLDIDSREALVMALNDFQGAVVLISHDRHLVEACADRLWLVAEGKVEPYDGDMEDYRRLILQGPEAVQRARDKAAEEAAKASGQIKRREAAQKRGQLKPLKQKIDATDKEIRRLQDKIRKLDTALADPGFFTREPERATKFTKERAFCEKKLGKAEEEWLELSAEYEEAS